jgi:hypothetical protein
MKWSSERGGESGRRQKRRGAGQEHGRSTRLGARGWTRETNRRADRGSTGWLEEGLAGGSGCRLTSEWSGWYLGGVVGETSRKAI